MQAVLRSLDTEGPGSWTDRGSEQYGFEPIEQFARHCV